MLAADDTVKAAYGTVDGTDKHLFGRL